MGLGNMWNVQHSAFASSLIACYHSTLKEEFGMDRHLGLLETGVEIGIRHLEEFYAVYEKYHHLKSEIFLNLDCFLGIPCDRNETVQSILTRYLVDDKLVAFKGKLVGPLIHDRAWLTSLKSPEAGRWLTVVPRNDEFRFYNVHYDISLRLRFFFSRPPALF